MTKILPFIDKYNWEGINFPSEKVNQKIFEKNYLKIAPNICVRKTKKKTNPAYV